MESPCYVGYISFGGPIK